MKAVIYYTDKDNSFIIALDKDIQEIPEAEGRLLEDSHYKGSLLNNNSQKIIIPCNNEEPLELYEKIVKTLSTKLSLQIVEDASVEKFKQKADLDKHSFEEFSEQARKIRNNECSKSDFEEFKKSLEPFAIELKFFQLLSAYHISFAQHACNFSVPGAGKTITVYAAYNYLNQLQKSDKCVNNLIVVGPLSCFRSWKQDYQKLFQKQHNFIEISQQITKSEVKNLLHKINNHHNVLITYQSLDSYLDILINFIKIQSLNQSGVMIVLDEAHRIKKIEDGIWSQAALKLAPYANSRIILTGTPAPNGYEDLYNIFKFIYPRKNIIGFSKYQLVDMNEDTSDDRIQKLKKNVEPFFLRTTKKQLKLPNPIFESPIVASMQPIQQRIYNHLCDLTHNFRSLDNNQDFRSILIRLRQTASNPNLLNYAIIDEVENNRAQFDQDSMNNNFLTPDLKSLLTNYLDKEIPSKFDQTLTICRDIIKNQGKVIIWCEFIGNIKDLSHYLSKNGIDSENLYGSIDANEREMIIDRFHKDDGLKVILANPHAVGESISLHKACHNAIYFEQSFNAAIYMQSKDRIHRLGLTEEDGDTRYYFLHSQDTIDESIYSRVMEKEEKMLQTLESNEIPLFIDNYDYQVDEGDIQSIKSSIRSYYERFNKVGG